MAHRTVALTLAPRPDATSDRVGTDLTRIHGEAALPEHGTEAVPSLVLPPLARVTGLAGIQRTLPPTLPHLIDLATRAAADRGVALGASTVLVAGVDETGSTVAALDHGALLDATDPRADGPFGPAACGSLPSISVVELAFSGRFVDRDAFTAWLDRGGLAAYLGTADLAEAQRRADAGDARAAQVLDALGYQLGKALGGLAAAVSGRLDAIVLIGLEDAPSIGSRVRAMVSWIAPILGGRP